MEFFKIRFGNDLDELTSKFEKTLEDMLGTMGPSFMLSERTWRPPMDMYETRTEVVILAEIGGVDKEDLEVEISSKAVRVQGSRRAPSCCQDCTYRLAEIQYGRFERILFLPSPIDPEKVTAASKNGFLEIRLVKRPTDQTFKVSIAHE
ncbi:MAG TPA: Hsp20/alpha crystallin family protein [Desulfobacterales bacterium]|jgi:HSP20 family protein|nr:Hsp20/alpha crystallin family protein [Desulfobacterales bacterium]HSM90139.1 Hsp20/alpha crystallin family protein [Desulfobacterales bacterium]